MCVLVIGLGSARLSSEMMMRGQDSNPDGTGWAVVYGDGDGLGIVSGKTLDWREGLEGLPALLDGLGDRVVCWAWHARIATSGGVNLAGCHPHQIGGDPERLLFHNGMLPLAPDTGMSDTATFASRVLPAMGGVAALDDRVVARMVEDWAAGSKLAVLSTDPASPLVFLNEEEGKWEGDLWFSNSSCEAPRWRSVKVAAPVSSAVVHRATWSPTGSLTETWSRTGWADPDEAPDDAPDEAPDDWVPEGVQVCDDGTWLCVGCWHSVAVGDDDCDLCSMCLWCADWSGACYCELAPIPAGSVDV